MYKGIEDLKNHPELVEFEAQLKIIEVLMGNANKQLRNAMSAIDNVKEEVNRLLNTGPMKNLPEDFKKQVFGDLFEMVDENKEIS
tara:strand:- start:421 stop:675 length:255 start_codon:yes stop_codon:yes gene_type:complete